MMNARKLYIVGSGGFGREVLWLARRINAFAKNRLPISEQSEYSSQASLEASFVWDIAGFIDDNISLHGTAQDDCKVVGGCDYFQEYQEEAWVVIAIGSARVKKIVADKLKAYPHVHFATLIDPSVTLSDRIRIGEGCVICAGNILTVDITIGDHVILNLDCTVGHDAVIEDYVTVYPSVNISGNVHVGALSELGTGAQIIQGITIGSQSILGAGAVAIRDIPDGCTAVGSPAKPVKYFENIKTLANTTPPRLKKVLTSHRVSHRLFTKAFNKTLNRTPTVCEGNLTFTSGCSSYKKEVPAA